VSPRELRVAIARRRPVESDAQTRVGADRPETAQVIVPESEHQSHGPRASGRVPGRSRSDATHRAAPFPAAVATSAAVGRRQSPAAAPPSRRPPQKSRASRYENTSRDLAPGGGGGAYHLSPVAASRQASAAAGRGAGASGGRDRARNAA